MKNVYITIGGSGTRLKPISPVDKHLLYWNNKRIIEWILHIVPDARIIGEKKTNSRFETLQELKNKKNCLIIDCDIIPLGINLDFNSNTDCVWCFKSHKNKWGSAIVQNNKLISASEQTRISDIKLSGAYYTTSMNDLLDRMESNNKNSIASGLIGSDVLIENTFVRLGDVEDYFNAIKYVIKTK
jgi:hypothetical protein